MEMCKNFTIFNDLIEQIFKIQFFIERYPNFTNHTENYELQQNRKKLKTKLTKTYGKSGKFSILRKLTKLKFESYEFDNLYLTKKRTPSYIGNITSYLVFYPTVAP